MARVESGTSAGPQDAVTTLRAARSPCLAAFEGVAGELEEELRRAEDNVAALEALKLPCHEIAGAPLEVSSPESYGWSVQYRNRKNFCPDSKEE